MKEFLLIGFNEYEAKIHIVKLLSLENIQLVFARFEYLLFPFRAKNDSAWDRYTCHAEHLI